jgi:hypothetical protein
VRAAPFLKPLVKPFIHIAHGLGGCLAFAAGIY